MYAKTTLFGISLIYNKIKHLLFAWSYKNKSKLNTTQQTRLPNTVFKSAR